MNRKKKSFARMLRFSLGLAVVAAAPAAAELLAISSAAFGTPMGGNFRNDTRYLLDEGRREFFNGAPSACMFAPVQLPEPAEVQAMLLWAVDANESADITVRLHRKDTTNNNSEVVIEIATSGTGSGAWGGFPPSAAHTRYDKEDDSWYLEACLGDELDLELESVLIQFDGRPSGIDLSSPVLVPGAAFQMERGWGSSYSFPRGFIRANDTYGGNGCLIGAVSLPTGATIRGLSADLWDDSSSNFSVQLRRKRLGSYQASEVIAEVATSGSAIAVRRFNTTSLAHPLVSTDYAYFLTTTDNCLELDFTQRIHRVRIYHDDLIFGDGFEGGNTNRWSAPSEFLTLSGAAFRKQYSVGIGTDFDPVTGIWEFSWPAEFCFVAPVTLPHGAEIIAFMGYLVDSDPDQDMTMTLRRKPVASGVSQLVDSVTTSGSSGLQTTAAFVYTTVDNGGEHWYLETCIPEGDGDDYANYGLQGAQISYYLP